MNSVRQDLSRRRDPAKARILQRFFKCAKGEYGAGDRFLGIPVPQQREVAKQHRNIPLLEVQALLDSSWHELRLTGLFILVGQYAAATSDSERAALYGFYLENLGRINNWDLVDASCEHIVGAYLQDRDRRPLHVLARSRNVWRRRIAIVSTFHFIKRGEWKETLRIARMLLSDRHDLVHKATGWMLREVGKRASQPALEAFLDQHAANMPRTMLRYAIERMAEPRRRYFMQLQR